MSTAELILVPPAQLYVWWPHMDADLVLHDSHIYFGTSMEMGPNENHTVVYFSKFRQGNGAHLQFRPIFFFWRCAQVPWVPVAEVEYINNCSHLPSATGIEIAAGPQPAQITQVSSWDLLFRCGMIWTVGSACSCHWHRFYMPPGISWFIIL